MMPRPLDFSDICFPYRRCHGKQKHAVNERTMKICMSPVDRYCIIVLWMKRVAVKFLA